MLSLPVVRTIVRLLIAASIAGLIIWVGFHSSTLKPQQLAEELAAFGALAPIAFVLARVLGAVLLVPGSLLAIAAGILFGPVWGAVYNLIASTAGAVLAFCIARFLAAGWVAGTIGKRLQLARLVRGVEAEGWRFVAFVRLVPLFPYNLVNYALGLTSIKLSHYTLASLVCMVPADIAYTYLGHAGREAVAGRPGATQSALIAVGFLAVLAFLPGFVRRYSQRNRNESHEF